MCNNFNSHCYVLINMFLRIIVIRLSAVTNFSPKQIMVITSSNEIKKISLKLETKATKLNFYFNTTLT